MPPSPTPESQPTASSPSSFVVGADVLVRRYGDVVLACSRTDAAFRVPAIVRISGTALVVWDALSTEPDLARVGQGIARRYVIDEATAIADVRAVVTQWCAVGIVEPTGVRRGPTS